MTTAKEIARKQQVELMLLGVKEKEDHSGLSASLKELLDGLREELRNEGITVLSRLKSGKPAEEILKSTKECDMVAMATHGRSGVSRLWSGSVAEEVLRHCERPTLILRAVAIPVAGS